MKHTVPVYINGLTPGSPEEIGTDIVIFDARLNCNDPKYQLLKGCSDQDGVFQGEIDSEFIGNEVRLCVMHLRFKYININLVVEYYGLFHSVKLELDRVYLVKDDQELNRWRILNSNQQYSCAQREIQKMILALQSPLDLRHFSDRKLSASEVVKVVQMIVDKFKNLVEKQGLAKLFWYKNQPLNESKSQGLFFAVADSYCEANDLDLSPEVNSGAGAIDFKVSSGYRNRVLVELKLSTNNKLVHGYETQLEIYHDAEKSYYCIYLVINVGNLGDKLTRIEQIRGERIKVGNRTSDIVVVDGRIKASASRR